MQLEFFDIPSPCIGICQTDEKGYCLGCLRTRDERQTWKDFSVDDKQKVIKRCLQRKKRKAKRIEKDESIDTSIEKIIDDVDENRQPSLLEPQNKEKVIDNSEIDFGDFEL